MKNAIITLACVVICFVLIKNNNALSQLAYNRELVKEFTDEGARTGSLFVDKDALREGYIKFARDEGRRACSNVTGYNLTNSNIKDDIAWTLSFMEDMESPAVIMITKFRGKNIKSTYEYKF